MVERPILMSAPMVRAILAGAKTQTRRIVRKQFSDDAMVAEVAATTPERWQVSGHSGLWWDDGGACIDDAVRCPYGMPGDRLWVREAWGFNPDYPGQFSHICFRADPGYEHDGIKWVPSIHMPRKASRILLKVTGVRVERLQDISIADAIAEGCPGGNHGDRYAAIDQYRALWDSLNAANRSTLPSNVNSKRYARVKEWLDKNPDTTGWAANPWVWAITFKVVQP